MRSLCLLCVGDGCHGTAALPRGSWAELCAYVLILPHIHTHTHTHMHAVVYSTRFPERGRCGLQSRPSVRLLSPKERRAALPTSGHVRWAGVRLSRMIVIIHSRLLVCTRVCVVAFCVDAWLYLMIELEGGRGYVEVHLRTGLYATHLSHVHARIHRANVEESSHHNHWHRHHPHRPQYRQHHTRGRN